MNNKLYIGFHIAKTAGSSLITSFEKRLSYPGFIQLSDMNRYFQEGKLFPSEIPDKNRIKVIFGHQVTDRSLSFFSKRDLFTFTFLRDPKEMLGSHYAFHLRLKEIQGATPLTPDEFNRLRGDNFICNSLIQAFPHFSGNEGTILDRARRVMKTFNLVISLSDYKEKMSTLEKSLGLSLDLDEKPKNVTTKKERETVDGLLSFTESANYSDITLYKEYLANSTSNNPFGFDRLSRDKMVQALGKTNLMKEEIEFLTRAMKNEVVAYEGSEASYTEFYKSLNARRYVMGNQ